jgi:hypothetical protein
MSIVSIISNVAPILGTALGGPAGGLVGNLISHALGGIDISKPQDIQKKIESDPNAIIKLKELEAQVADVQNAREESSRETGYLRFVRPLLALTAMFAVFIDIILIKYVVDDDVIKDILVLMMIFLVWDIRQIYKFYFGNQDQIPGFIFGRLKK